jgi:flagellar basal body rod protein FlgG
LPLGEVEISEDGSISVAQQAVDRIKVVEFENRPALVKVGHSYFRSADSAAGRAPTRTSVRQHHLEASNVNPAEAAVRLVAVARQFEMLGRAVTLVANEMNRRAIDEIPRAGS